MTTPSGFFLQEKGVWGSGSRRSCSLSVWGPPPPGKKRGAPLGSTLHSGSCGLQLSGSWEPGSRQEFWGAGLLGNSFLVSWEGRELWHSPRPHVSSSGNTTISKWMMTGTFRVCVWRGGCNQVTKPKRESPGDTLSRWRGRG